MKEILQFAKQQLHLTEIVGRCAKENPASANVMKKLGFVYEKDIPYWCNCGTMLYEGIQLRLYMRYVNVHYTI